MSYAFRKTASIFLALFLALSTSAASPIQLGSGVCVTSEIWQENPSWGTFWGYTAAMEAGLTTAKAINVPSGTTWTFQFSSKVAADANGGIIDELYMGPAVSGNCPSCTITITTDGTNTVYSGLWNNLGCDYYTNVRYDTTYVMSHATSFNLRVRVPFQHDIAITFKNNSGSTAHWWYDIHGKYNLGQLNYANSNHLHITTVSATKSKHNALVPFTGNNKSGQLTYLDASGVGPGVIFGVCELIDSYPGSAVPSTAPLEGFTRVYIDSGYTSGTPAMVWTGTEEEFGASAYFTDTPSSTLNNNFSFPNTPQRGLVFHNGTTWQTVNFMEKDPIYFNKSVKWIKDNGEPPSSSGAPPLGVKFTGTTDITATVFWYTRN
jgi:hypothetical protein